MFVFTNVGELKPLGKANQLKVFNKFCEEQNFTSVEKLLASLICRFSFSSNCPILSVKRPRAGDENVDGIICLRDMNDEEAARVFFLTRCFCLEELGDNFVWQENNNVWLFLKEEFISGEWSKYDYKLCGKDGVSIPPKR